MGLVVHHCRQSWEWPRDDIRLWHFSAVYRRWMGNTETSCIKYLCHNWREVSNKEACVCALTLYRANNTALRTKQVMWLRMWMSIFCEQCLQLHVHSWLCLYQLHNHDTKGQAWRALKVDVTCDKLPGSHGGYYSQLSCMVWHLTILSMDTNILVEHAAIIFRVSVR